MKVIVLGILISFAFTGQCIAEVYECTVLDGGYQYPGQSKLVDAIERDPTLKNRTFHVDRTTGKISGTVLFSNEGDTIRVIRDVNENINVYVIASTSEKMDITILSIREFEGKLTFRCYIEFFGLFLTGECKKL